MITKWGSDQTWWQSVIGHRNPIPKLNNENRLFGIKFRSSSYLHQGLFSQIPQVGRLLRSPALISDCLRGDVAHLQKCCYKWQPWKCLGLDVTNLIIYIYKNGRKKP